MTPSPSSAVFSSEEMRERYVLAQARWPGVLVAFEAFEQRLARACEQAAGRCDPSQVATEDIYLAVALEGGDRHALEIFHRENYQFLRALSRRQSLNAEDAEDIAQDLCATIGERVRKYLGVGSLRGWLARVAPNVTRDLYRSGFEARERSLDQMAESAPDPMALSESALTSDEGAGAEKMRAVLDRPRCREMFEKTLAAAMERLTPEQRELIRYRYQQGLKGREIARLRGVGEYVISKHLKKALARLEKRILMLATTAFHFTTQEVRDCLGLMR